ncbi:MAG: hypothetical protein ACQESJ_01975 [Bacteroidota bacterium]
MPRLTKETKKQIKNLPKEELQEIVFKLASKNKIAYEYIQINYLDESKGEQELFEKTKDEIDTLRFKGYKGFSDQLQAANMLAACIKRINEFKEISSNKSMEADLLLYVLEISFSFPDDFFGTCFTKFDFKVGQILKRLMTLVTKKMNKDYRADYEDNINEYLKRLHQTSNHIDLIYNLPEAI